jgi:hypothetical protein
MDALTPRRPPPPPKKTRRKRARLCVVALQIAWPGRVASALLAGAELGVAGGQCPGVPNSQAFKHGN